MCCEGEGIEDDSPKEILLTRECESPSPKQPKPHKGKEKMKMKMTKKNAVEVKTIAGMKCAVARVTCHTDEGAMKHGRWNYGDDLAFETSKVGNKSLEDLKQELGEGWSDLIVPVSCVKDKAWAKKHPEFFSSDEGREKCYKVEGVALIISPEMYAHILKESGVGCAAYLNSSNRFDFWKTYRKYWKEATGTELEFYPDPQIIFLDEFKKAQARWEREVLGK